ncbi:MAG: rRNA maturation RNase YbeY [Acidiferrobacterales bacterium]
MRLRVNVEVASSTPALPDKTLLMQWAEAAMDGYEQDTAELGVRIVDEAEITELNSRYRQKREPTNVLSFPFEDPPGVHTDLLGDVVICAPVVNRQAQTQGKQTAAHWAHMVVHGIMHLRGYDHQTPGQAHVMESMEAGVLKRLGFPDPYVRR